MTFDAGGDLCLGFFRKAWDADVLHFPPQARVLEMGCAEANWLQAMRDVRPDLHLTGMDVRKVARPAADVVHQGDLLTTTLFTPAQFDAIVAVSMVEWAGIGAYGDPVDADGDRTVMARAREWVKPSGWLYFDVPFNPLGTGLVMRHRLRAYDDAALQDRLFTTHWVPRWQRHFSGNGHQDGPYVALVVTPA